MMSKVSSSWHCGLCHIFSSAIVHVQTLAKHLHLASPYHAVWAIWSWQVLWDMAESGRVLFAGVGEGVHWASWCQHLASCAAGVWCIDPLAPWKLRHGLELGLVGKVWVPLLLEYAVSFRIHFKGLMEADRKWNLAIVYYDWSLMGKPLKVPNICL